MRARWFFAALGLVALAPALWALPAPQRGGGGGITGPGGVEGAVMGSESAREMTPFEEFADRLKLDKKTQVPQAAEIVNAAAAEAAPVGVQMLQLRQRLLNDDLSGDAAEAKSVLDAYTAAAAKMSHIEADAFSKIYALLEPNQQSRAPQAFALMAGFFQSTPGSGRGGRGGGR